MLITCHFRFQNNRIFLKSIHIIYHSLPKLKTLFIIAKNIVICIGVCIVYLINEL